MQPTKESKRAKMIRIVCVCVVVLVQGLLGCMHATVCPHCFESQQHRGRGCLLSASEFAGGPNQKRHPTVRASVTPKAPANRRFWLASSSVSSIPAPAGRFFPRDLHRATCSDPCIRPPFFFLFLVVWLGFVMHGAQIKHVQNPTRKRSASTHDTLPINKTMQNHTL